MKYQERKYRKLFSAEELVSFSVCVKETDLHIHAEKNLSKIVKESIYKHRGYIETYIEQNPGFVKALGPWQDSRPVPAIVGDMIKASKKSGVGPMAAVAGALAEKVGTDLLVHSEEVIIENGGDLFIKTNKPLQTGIYAGESALSMSFGVKIDSENRPVGVCTSSGTIGHSLSLGKADAVCVISESCSLADAAATAVGNLVKFKSDINKAIDFGKEIEGVLGLVIILDDKIGLWGDIELHPLT